LAFAAEALSPCTNACLDHDFIFFAGHWTAETLDTQDMGGASVSTRRWKVNDKHRERLFVINFSGIITGFWWSPGDLQTWGSTSWKPRPIAGKLILAKTSGYRWFITGTSPPHPDPVGFLHQLLVSRNVGTPFSLDIDQQLVN
jgi:hypothetical protein